MKIRSPWLVALAGWMISMIVRTWMRTIRFEYHPQEKRYDPNDPGFEGRYLYCFWHEHILVPASQYARPDIQVLISKHADGQKDHEDRDTEARAEGADQNAHGHQRSADQKQAVDAAGVHSNPLSLKRMTTAVCR